MVADPLIFVGSVGGKKLCDLLQKRWIPFPQSWVDKYNAAIDKGRQLQQEENERKC